MIFRASVIFLTYLICNLVTLFIIYVPQFIIDLCHHDRRISLSGYGSIISLPEKIYTSVLSLDMDRSLVILLILICSIKIICGVVFSILGAVSWKISGRLHPCFGILACLCVPFITMGIYDVSFDFFYDAELHNAASGIASTFAVIIFMYETGFICFTWWIAKNFCDTKGREIGISLKSTDEKAKYAFLFSFYIFLISIVLILPISPLLVMPFFDEPDVNNAAEYLVGIGNFLIMLYDLLIIITVIFSTIYAFYRLSFKTGLKMKQYTRVTIIFTTVMQLLLWTAILSFVFHSIGKEMSEKYAGHLDTIFPLTICVFFVGMNLCFFGILSSLSFWLARFLTGKFKTYDEANI